MQAYNKAIVAAIMGVIQLLNIWFDIPLVDETQVAAVVGLLTPIVVYLIPNKKQ